jgi:hypothetical protein
MKRNEVKKAQRNKTKEAKRKNKSKISKNICFEAK